MRATSNGTVRRLVFDFGVPVTHSRRNRVLVRCTRIEPFGPVWRGAKDYVANL
jgi:hypothetical protein